ncbi:hypothetical protein FH972_022095 [Carpinus fangiana]|uniref:Uncharacterized protein n=1 Tax=Carpinus fangiana TaxID=176857 RepID=A0A5N6KRK9_9ROSI|nr:hypothetical protein FH972_022095 [Carpinus fangiana]
MKFHSLLTVASVLHLSNGATTDAPGLSTSPGHSYVANFYETDTTYGVNGSLVIAPSSMGPASVTLSIGNLPATGGPFIYHIHTHTVPKLEDGSLNCTAALTHLDPYDRGETPKCDSSKPESCQVGDLSGKHGAIPMGHEGVYTTTFTDAYISTYAGSKDDAAARAFVGSARSVVVHLANKTRIACANLEKLPNMIPAPQGGSSNQTAPYPIPGNGTLPTGTPPMVTAPGTAPHVPKSTVVMTILPTGATSTSGSGPTRTTGAAGSIQSIGAGVRVGSGAQWAAGVGMIGMLGLAF